MVRFIFLSSYPYILSLEQTFGPTGVQDRRFLIDRMVMKCESDQCGLVTPYGDTDLGQHLLRRWLVEPMFGSH